MAKLRTIKRATRTTIYILEKDIVQDHMFHIKEKNFKDYINRLIGEDIVRNGNEDAIRNYFKEGKQDL